MRIPSSTVYLLLLLCALNNAMGGNNNDSSIIIKPNWRKGEIKKYEIVQKTKVSFYSLQTISEISLMVRDVAANYIELEWRYDTIKELDSLNQNSGEPKKSSQLLLLNGKAIKYRTDLEGKITEIINFPELSSQLKPSIDSITPAFMKSFSPNYFASYVLKDLLIFHRIYGQELKISDTIIFRKEYSISPNITLPSVSFKVTLKDSELKTGSGLTIVGKSLGIDDTKATSNFTYEFLPNSFWVKRYNLMISTSLPNGLVTNEYDMILLP